MNFCTLVSVEKLSVLRLEMRDVLDKRVRESKGKFGDTQADLRSHSWRSHHEVIAGLLCARHYALSFHIYSLSDLHKRLNCLLRATE